VKALYAGLASLAVAVLVWSSVVRADGPGFAASVAGLARPTSEEVSRAADDIGKTQDPKALGVLEALMDGDVLVSDSGRVSVRGADGSVKDAVTGAQVGEAGLHSATVDNGVRRTLEPIIARLQLLSKEASVRRKGVEFLAGRATPEDAAVLRQALEHETDRAVRRDIVSSLAELDLSSDDPQRRITAIEAIASEGSMRLRSRIEALASAGPDGKTTEPDARVRAAAAVALRSLDRKRFFVDTTADLLYGTSLGSVLLLSALGLAITFGLMGVINMAHGEMIMLGAYATYVTQLFFRVHLPRYESLYLVAAAPVALVTCMAVGAMLERLVVRYLYKRALETLLATWGLSLILIQTVRLVFGAQNVAVENPPWLSGGTEIFEGVVLPYNRIAVVLFTTVVVAFVAYVLRGTSLGLRVRAVTQNRPMAACMGISTARVDMWTFALGSGVGGLAGVALTQLGNVGPELGQGYIVDAFLVVVLGGVGKLAGSVFAAMALGILNKLLEPVAGAVLGKILVLMAVVLVIQKRPQGLFAPRVRGVEAS
jgi:urea transport system permease protein